jgi:hypothetical protein
MRYCKKLALGMMPLIVMIICLSCKKEAELPCYECVSTQIIITSPVLDGYPDTITNSTEKCDMAPDQIRSYEQSYGGSYTLVIPSVTHPEGVMYQFIYFRNCTIK